MQSKSKYNLNFRPKSYFNTTLQSTAIREAIGFSKPELFIKGKTANIKKRAIKQLIDLSANINPVLLAGRFLPDYKNREEEIARIVLDNNERDTMSIRARPWGDKILYRVVDEHDTKYKCTPPQAISPLTMKEMITLISSITDESGKRGFTNPFRDYPNLLNVIPKDELLDFITVFSLYYPDLEIWYKEEAKEWYRKLSILKR